MKRALFLLVPLAGLFAGCASTKLELASFSPLGVLSVQGNLVVHEVDSANEIDEDAGGMISDALNKALGGKNPEVSTAQNRVDYAEECLRLSLEDIAGIQVVDREKLTGSDNYKYAKTNVLSFMDTSVVATGYEPDMLSLGAKKSRILMKEVGASGLISAEFEFDKRISRNQVSAVVKMKVRLFDERGKNVLTKEYMAESADKLDVHGIYDNKYDKEAFVEFFKPVTETVIRTFIMECL